jgi:hypothetical protein
MTKEPGRRTMMVVFLHEDGSALNAVLKNAAQCHSACNIDPLSRGIGVQN